MRERLVRAIIDSVTQTFRTMVGLNAALVSSHASMAESFDGMSSIITLSGGVAGSISVHCEESAALAMTSRLLGVNIRQAGPDVLDAVGEFANVVAGMAKRSLSPADSFDISTPTLVFGRHPIGGAGSMLEFNVEGMRVLVEIVVPVR